MLKLLKTITDSDISVEFESTPENFLNIRLCHRQLRVVFRIHVVDCTEPNVVKTLEQLYNNMKQYLKEL